jgi:hypothetical protein
MTVRIAKQPVNIREKLSELERPIGLKGSELMRAETAQEARELVGAGRRNLVINGDMRIDQRNAGASVSLSSGTPYICDRFLFEQGQAPSNASSAQRVTDSPDGFFHSLKFTRGAASFSSFGWSAFNQRIEGLLLSQLAWGTPSAKPITLSFWVKSTTPGTYSLNMTHYDGSNERWNVQEYNINSANTWEYKTLTFIGDSSYGFGSGGTSGWMRLYWHIGGDSGSAAATSFNTWVAGAGGIRASTKQVNLYNISEATLQITGVQLEVGKVATPFEHRSYGEELALCQRYCYVIRGDFPSTQSGEVGIGEGVWNGTDGAYVVVKHPVLMRTNPSLDFGNAGWYRVVAEAVAWRGVSAISLLTDSSSINQTAIYPRAVTDSRGLVTRMTTQSTAAKFILSAEL